MDGCGRNASISSGSTRWKKPETAEKNGGGSTTPSGPIPRWTTKHQQPMPLLGTSNKQTEKPANLMPGPTLGGHTTEIPASLIPGPISGDTTILILPPNVSPMSLTTAV
jgi:hypothetical protein